MTFFQFADRHDAGKRLGLELQRERLHDPLVLGLPRGGIPVAAEVAATLGAPLDTIVVRKIGAPFQPELAVGAIASGNVLVYNEELVPGVFAPDDPQIREITAREQRELERREQLYRGQKPRPELAGRNVILVDDGLATGSTMRAAIDAVRLQDPARVIVAVPTGARRTVQALAAAADRVICLQSPEPFYAVGQAYRHFDQTSDEEVRNLLAGDANAAR